MMLLVLMMMLLVVMRMLLLVMMMLLVLVKLLWTCSLEDTSNSKEDQRSPLGQTQHPLEDHLEEKYVHSISTFVFIVQIIQA